MALTRIYSFSSPAFVSAQPETNVYFIGKYKSPIYTKFRFSSEDPRPRIEFNVHFIGKYGLTQLARSRWLFSYDSSISSSSVDFVYTITGTMPYTIARSLAAAGTTQGAATPLTSQDNEITSSTSGVSEGVIITLVTPGIPTIVHNYSGNDIFLWPPVGGQINKLGVNVKYRIVDGS